MEETKEKKNNGGQTRCLLQVAALGLRLSMNNEARAKQHEAHLSCRCNQHGNNYVNLCEACTLILPKQRHETRVKQCQDRKSNVDSHAQVRYQWRPKSLQDRTFIKPCEIPIKKPKSHALSEESQADDQAKEKKLTIKLRRESPSFGRLTYSKTTFRALINSKVLPPVISYLDLEL